MRLHEIKSQINEGPFDALKSVGKTVGGFAKKAATVASNVVDKATDASGEGEKQQYIKDQQTKYARWVNQTQQKGTNPADIDVIAKYLTTQLRFTPQQLLGVYKTVGINTSNMKDTEPAQHQYGPDDTLSTGRDVAINNPQNTQSGRKEKKGTTPPPKGWKPEYGPNVEDIPSRDVKKPQLPPPNKKLESKEFNGTDLTEGTIVDKTIYSGIWQEVIRQLFSTGRIRSNPANNPLNKAGAFVSAMAGKNPYASSYHGNDNQRSQGVKWSDSEELSNLAPFADALNGMENLTDDEKKAAIDAVMAMRQSKK
jgi:hypothetical protein